MARHGMCRAISFALVDHNQQIVTPCTIDSAFLAIIFYRIVILGVDELPIRAILVEDDQNDNLGYTFHFREAEVTSQEDGQN
jgi:hypothetical protein